MSTATARHRVGGLCAAGPARASPKGGNTRSALASDAGQLVREWRQHQRSAPAEPRNQVFCARART